MPTSFTRHPCASRFPMAAAYLLPVALVLSALACDSQSTTPATENQSQEAEPTDAKPSEVDLDAAKKAFECDQPPDNAAKRACEGLDAFASGGPLTRFPPEGSSLHMARTECSTDPHGMIKFTIATLSAGGVLELQFEAWPREPRKERAATRIIGDLRRGGEPSEPAPEESADGYAPQTLEKMKETWAIVAPVKLDLAPIAQSTREAPARPGAGPAYWRETKANLVRVSPPSDKYGWCVDLYYPVPQ